VQLSLSGAASGFHQEDALMSPARGLLLLTACLALGLGLRSHAEPPPAKGRKPAPEGKKAVRTDRYGDPLPAGATARLGTVRWRHSRPVDAVAVSPDGKTLASGGWDGGSDRSLCLWEVPSGKRLWARSLPERDWVEALAFSSDGKILAAAGLYGQFPLLEAATGKQRRLIQIEDANFLTVAFSPDNKRVSAN
jgi:WD40 repeat protein